MTQNYKFAKFSPKTEMCFTLYEIWDLEQIEFGPKIEMSVMFTNFDTQN